jgi:hypothetical protein
MSTTTAASGKHCRTDFATTYLDLQRALGRALAQQAKDGSGEVAFQGAERFQATLPGGLLALQVGRARGSQRPWTIAILCSALVS